MLAYLRSQLNKTSFGRLARVFFGLALFTLPLRITTLFYAGSAYTSGYFNEYAAFFLYGSEVLLWLSLLAFGIAVLLGERPKLALSVLRPVAQPALVLLAVSSVAAVLAADPLLALLQLWRLLELYLLAGLLAVGFLPHLIVLRILVASFALQALLGVWQYSGGGSLGLAFLGESFAEPATFNVAKVLLPDGTLAIRALGTLAHANILGGLLVLVLLLFAAYPYKSFWHYLLAVLLLVGLFFTFSRAAFLAFFLGLGALVAFNFRRRIVSAFAAVSTFALLILLFGSPLFIRFGETGAALAGRTEQLVTAWQIYQCAPLGVGAGGYTTALAEAVPDLPVHALQPVHNFFVLVAVEQSPLVALLWLYIFGLLAYHAIRQRRGTALAGILAVFTLAQFDHYFQTAFAGQALLFVSLAFVLVQLATPEDFTRKAV
jgi:hypothetical protein